jgi:hypothetical protein
MAGEVLDTQEFENLEELIHALEYWKNYISSLGHETYTVLPLSPGRLVLIEETLTDGSKALNFAISGAD